VGCVSPTRNGICLKANAEQLIASCAQHASCLCRERMLTTLGNVRPQEFKLRQIQLVDLTCQLVAVVESIDLPDEPGSRRVVSPLVAQNLFQGRELVGRCRQIMLRAHLAALRAA
jgi:hypothetical protein